MATAKPRLREYDYSQLITGKVGKTLTVRRPHAVFQVLEAQLRKITAIDPNGLFWISRQAIEPAEQNFYEQPMNSLIDGIRDALLALADGEYAELPKLLEHLLQEASPIYKRLALFVLMERPRLLSSVPPDLILPSEIYDHAEYHEQARLLNERFAELPQTLQERVHSYLDLCIAASERDDGERLARRAWRLVNVLPESALRSTEKKFRERTAEKRGGLMENPLFEIWMSGVRAMTAPAKTDELRALFESGGYDKLLEALRNPKEHFQLEWYQDAELLWSEVAALVHEDPSRHLELASKISVADFPGAWRYFDAYEQLSKQGIEFAWGPLLTAIAQLIDGPDSTVAYWSLAHILKHAAFSATNRVKTEDLELLSNAVERILQGTCTALESYAQIERDLGFHQLNEPGGTSADAFIGVCFRRAYDASDDEERRTNLPERRRLDERSKQLLALAVQEGWGGIELRHSIGQMLHLVLWADSAWLSENVDSLLPLSLDDPAVIGAWRGFWAGHLREERLYEPVIKCLFERYQWLIADASREQPLVLMEAALLGHDRDALGDHLRVAWLRGYDGFGQDGLFGQFYENASDESRARVVFALVPDLTHANSTDDQAWKRRILQELYSFWDNRLQAAASAPPNSTPKEMSAFCLWLSVISDDLGAIVARLQIMIPRIDKGFEHDLVVEYLERHVETGSAGIAKLLPLVVEGLPTGPEGPWHAAKIPPLIERAWQQVDDAESRGTLTKAASLLLERFGIDLRPALGL